MLITPRELEKYGFKQITVDHYKGHQNEVKVWEDEDRLNRYTINGTRVTTISELLSELGLNVVAMARGRVNQDIEIPVFETSNGKYYYKGSRIFDNKSDAVKSVFKHINTL